MAGNDLTEAFRRYYVSLSLAELRRSWMFGDAGRLPYNTVLYLDFIYAHPGCTATQISEATGVTKATVSSTVSRLERKGLVIRERSDHDGRVLHLRMPDGLSEAYGEFCGITPDAVEFLSAGHTAEELELFCRMLDEVSSRMEQDAGVPEMAKSWSKIRPYGSA